MTTYARILSGRTVDVHVAPSEFYADLADLIKKTGVNGYVVVPDGTLNGATDNGNGTYTPPNVATPVEVIPTPVGPRYRSLPQYVIMDILNDVFGDTRFLAVLTALAALNTDVWLARMKRFNNCGAAFDRQRVVDFLTAARGADVPNSGAGPTGKITAAEITSVANDPRWVEA